MSTSRITAARSAPATGTRPRQPLMPLDYVLFTVSVLSWSASWYALKLQVGVVPVQVSIFWRYVLAAAVMIVWALLARAPMRFSLSTHVSFILMGGLMFCINFALFYYASAYLASGLLSVIFSLAAVFNIIIAMVFLGLRPGTNILFGALLGFIGIALMFWPEIAGQTFNRGALFGVGLCIAGTLSFCTGNLISASLQRRKISVLSASTWGMTYGAVLSAVIALLNGDEFIIDWSASYLASLVFLAVVSSVIAFAAYLTLLGRIGSDRAGYATVMFPVIALLISAVLEDYQMGALAIGGLVLVMIGNVFVLGSAKNKPQVNVSSKNH